MDINSLINQQEITRLVQNIIAARPATEGIRISEFTRTRRFDNLPSSQNTPMTSRDAQSTSNISTNTTTSTLTNVTTTTTAVTNTENRTSNRTSAEQELTQIKSQLQIWGHSDKLNSHEHKLNVKNKT